MTIFSPGIQVAMVIGFLIIFSTVVLTVRKYTTHPNRVAYPKNYGDGGEMNLPRVVVWLLPTFQIAIACFVAWGISLGRSHTHGDPLTALIVIDLALLTLFAAQRGVMLRPDLP